MTMKPKKTKNKRYSFADKTLEYLYDRFIEEFDDFKDISNFDELNIIRKSGDMFKRLDSLSRAGIKRVAAKSYDDIFEYYFATAEKKQFPKSAVKHLLSGYNPVTRYSYDNEVDRKRARFVESVLSAQTRQEIVGSADTSLRLWSDMTRQYVDEAEELGAIQAMKDNGVRYVRWITVVDERRCPTCRKRHNRVYRIDRVPPHPHWRCRCIVVPVL